MKFDHEGFRTDFKLDILDLTTEGFRKIGTWNITEGVNFTQVASEYEDPNEFQRQDLRNMSFVVMISLVSWGWMEKKKF